MRLILEWTGRFDVICTTHLVVHQQVKLTGKSRQVNANGYDFFGEST